MATKSFEGVVKHIQRANREASDRYNYRAQSRATASGILNPTEVAGDYDMERLLYTTMGGELRPLRPDDLEKFRKKATLLGKQFKGGITAKQIIERALPDDRKRCNEEIRVAIPAQSHQDKLHFVTSASGKHKVNRHHVVVQFKGYDAALSSPTTAESAAKSLVAQPIAIDCDCGRQTFWFRYVATLGNFNAGLPETGFPKIRNPTLSGVACKHILRTVQKLNDPLVLKRVAGMVELGRKGKGAKVVRTKAADARAMAAEQDKRAHWQRNQLESSTERAERLAARKAVGAVQTRLKAQQKAIATTPAAMQRELNRLEQTVKRLQAMGGLASTAAAALMRQFARKT
ncbi:hypothetical protein [Comamonas sp. HJ-2]